MIEIGTEVEILAIGKADAHYGNKNLLGLRGKVMKPCKTLKGGMFSCDLKLDDKSYGKNNMVFRSVRLKEIK